MAKKKSEKIKLYTLLGLFGVIVITVVYQFFFSTPAPRPSLRPGKSGSTENTRSGTTIQSPENAENVAIRQATSGKVNQQEMVRQLLDDMTPLDPRRMVAIGTAAVSPRGNIFDYYIEPPKPIVVPPPPPPPPIALQGISPASATAGTPRPFTLTVTAQNLPPDAKIFMNGSPRETRRVNETTLTTEMSPADYADARNSTIEVKSPGDPAKWYSNPMTFTAVALPEPPFKFIGILGEQALIEVTGTKEYLRLKVGDTVQRAWRVDAISNQAMNLTHIQFDIKKRVPLQEKGR
jgi:hypothetical protein